MVTLIIKDSSGEIVGEVVSKGEMNILDECSEHDVDIPFSCHAGACMSCAAQVVSGMEHIDQEMDGQKYIETDKDVCLTCIAGVKKESVDAADAYTVEVQMLM